MNKAGRGARFPLPLEQVHGGRRGASAHDVLRPQRPLHEAAQAAARASVPTGLGLDSPEVRSRMVERLRAAGIRNEAVLAAMVAVERHRFVDSALATQAWEDTSLPIGHGQTISKPSVVARMLALLSEGENAVRGGSLGRVLEIGTGCGYQAALLARLARSVVSIERLKELHEKARANLHGRRDGDLRLVWGDGRAGHAPWAPYDGIIAAAGGEALPAAWLEQLAVGGRLVAPVLDASGSEQMLVVVDRGADGYREQRLGAVRFVPLKSGRQ